MIKVGCCGFPTSMKKYYENFSVVELNSTFYEYPRMETVEGWRKKAPENFEYTVKAHQDISHKEKMKSTNACLEAFEKMKKICKILNSKILLIQTPGSFRPDKLGDVEKFFKEINRDDLTIVWETRGPAWESPQVYEKLRQVLESVDVVHVTDPFRVLPVYVGDVAYFRLHGLGEQMYYYQYSDLELQRLRELIAPYEKSGRTVYVLFNNLLMFEDAIRFREYLSKGVFPKIPSLSEVLEKVRFPTSKNILMKRFGWRLVEVEDGRQERLGSFLANLPSKAYESLKELLRDIEAVKKA
ncbi:MAG: DUF72 domain-containing protein [Candidatus Bathyarchaeota archaeon]|nr:DUF72 domain-containing protein [Candidatus Bathyarchaeota archaeon]MDI6805109.1 DUF72 domain-containing protein [Candidatus Bathyarchaeia archaeon]